MATTAAAPPTTGGAAAPAAGGKGRSRARLLLSNYYGVGSEENTAVALNPKNIDGAVFNAEVYFDDLLAQKDLKSLIKIDNDLLAETKKLDSDMKTLVYENYNKFISATDTIRQMKKNVVNMEEEIKRLAENMEKISSCSDEINLTLSTRREKIEELSGVYRLLKKRQFLFELPTRLKKCIELGAYGQAAEYYSGTSNIFNKFRHLNSFNAIQRECEEIIQNLRSVLKIKISDDSVETHVVAEYIGILLDLNVESVATLRSEFLSSKMKSFQRKFSSFSQQTEQYRTSKKTSIGNGDNNDNESNEDEQKKKKTTDEQSKKQTIDKFVSELMLNFLGDFLEFCATYQTLFLQIRQTNNSRRIAKSKNNSNQSQQQQQQILQSKQKLDEVTRSLFVDFLSIIRSLLMGEEDVKEVILGMEIVWRSISNIHNQFPDLNINDRASEFINSAVHSIIQNAFDSLQTSVIDKLKNVAATITNNPNVLSTLGELSTSLYQTAIGDIEKEITRISPFFAVKEQHLKFLAHQSLVFVAKFGVKIQHLFLSLNIALSELLESSQYQNNSKFFLVLAKFAFDLESTGVNRIYDLVVDTVTSSMEEDLNINKSELSGRIGKTGQNIVEHYVKIQGQKISQLIRKGIETRDWLSPKMLVPRDARLVVMIVSEIDSLHREVGSIFKQETIDSDGGNELKKAAKPRGRSEFGHQFSHSHYSSSIISSIITIFLKSFMECCRLRTFGQFGLQQIQVEAQFTRMVLEKYIGTRKKEKDAVDALINDIVSSTAERCVEPVFMDQNVVERICEKQLEKKSSTSS